MSSSFGVDPPIASAIAALVATGVGLPAGQLIVKVAFGTEAEVSR